MQAGLTLQQATLRVGNLLRRSDIDNEIQQWLNFALTELTDQVKFPELRTTLSPITLIPFIGFNAANTTTGDVATGSNQLLNVASTLGVAIGVSVTAPGVPAGTVVTGVVGNTVSMSLNATGTFPGTTINFGYMVSAAQAAQSYYYPMGVSDYDSMSSVYYSDLTLTPTRGWNLKPFPREFFKGDTVDFERILNRGNPGVGDPIYYFIDMTGGINVNGTLTTAGTPTLVIYPAFITPKVGTVTCTYNKIAPDWTGANSYPVINKRWHHYLVWLAYFYGMAFQEKDEIQKVGYWKSKADEVVNEVKMRVLKQETRSTVYNLPGIGMDFADKKY